MTPVDANGFDTAVTSREAWLVIVVLVFTRCAFTAAYWLCGWLDGKARVR